MSTQNPASIYAAPYFQSVEQAVAQLQAQDPVYLVHQHALEQKAALFLDSFLGTTMYAVKANPHPVILRTLFDAGIRHFDVASLAEIRLLRDLFGEQAHLAFMHPVKSMAAMQQAFFDYGVMHTVLDHPGELDKLLAIVPTAQRAKMTVFVRLKTPSHEEATYELSRKFGAAPELACTLLQSVHQAGFKVGLALHVGSQCVSASPYTAALALADDVLTQAAIPLEAIDVGGGFPAHYLQNETKPDIKAYFATIEAGLAPIRQSYPDADVYCEPGRVMVAEAVQLLTQVQLRKDNALYLNDGFYGGLAEVPLAHGTIELYAKAYNQNGGIDGPEMRFTLNGPTCDSIDAMGEAVSLPAPTQTGDWLVFDNMGAYSYALASNFNGLLTHQHVVLP